jgi:2'-5' RNA ligase
MYTIASLLDVDSEINIKNLWHILEEKCSLRGIRLTPLPHLSWQISEDYQLEAVEGFLADFSKHHRPFKIRPTGLGLFTGNKITLYLAMVHSNHLANLHKGLWNGLKNFGPGHLYYSPSYWVPHITLANKDVDQEKIACAIGELAGRSLNFDVTITSIAILYDRQGEMGVEAKYKLSG